MIYITVLVSFIYILIYITVLVSFICGWIIKNERSLRQKNTELYREREQERAVQAEQVADLVPDIGIQFHQYKTYVIRSFRTDIGHGCLIFSNDMKTRIGNTSEGCKTRDEAVKSAEAWIDEWLINRERNV